MAADLMDMKMSSERDFFKNIFGLQDDDIVLPDKPLSVKKEDLGFEIMDGDAFFDSVESPVSPPVSTPGFMKKNCGGGGLDPLAMAFAFSDLDGHEVDVTGLDLISDGLQDSEDFLVEKISQEIFESASSTTAANASPPSSSVKTSKDSLLLPDGPTQILTNLSSPLRNIRTRLEKKLQCDLSSFSIWLQGETVLDDHSTLSEQCVEGEGLVQVNISLCPEGRRIDILDVLKAEPDLQKDDLSVENGYTTEGGCGTGGIGQKARSSSSGYCRLTDLSLEASSSSSSPPPLPAAPPAKKPRVILGKYEEAKIFVNTDEASSVHRSGNNGNSVQLWRFLLDVLTDYKYRYCIQWSVGVASEDGEFVMTDPEGVARLWGQQKGKPTMNYEKLSRALRYYKGGNILDKVHNKKFTYRFVCDLRELVGFSAAQLEQQVREQQQRLNDFAKIP